MDSQTFAAIATAVTAGAALVYTFFTWRLWQQTKRQAQTATRQAETAERQAITAQQMLEAAHRPWVSIALHADTPTDPTLMTVSSVFRNYGNVPATVTTATMRAAWEGKTWAESDQLVPTGNPSNLCVFPGQRGELGWGIPNVSFAPWPKGGWIRLHLEITYRGAFQDRTYQTRIEVSTPVPEGKLGGRREIPMDVMKMETT